MKCISRWRRLEETPALPNTCILPRRALLVAHADELSHMPEKPALRNLGEPLVGRQSGTQTDRLTETSNVIEILSRLDQQNWYQ